MTRLVLAVLAVVAVISPAWLPAQAEAQFLIPGAQDALTLSLTPQYPAPNSTVKVTLQSSWYDLNAADISWSVNGKSLPQNNGERSLDVATGPLGSAVVVRAEVVDQNNPASVVATIVPTSIDLLWESDSYVPPFYAGRALPSAGSRIRLVALPHISRQNGAEIPASQLVFTWKKDSEVLESSSGRGKSSITVDGPTLFGTETISVEAASTDGLAAGQAIVRIPDTEPKLTLYEDHPLFGVLYHRALGTTTFVPKNEMTFAAIPFFASVSGPSDRLLEYEWHVNRKPVTIDPMRANEITINAASSTGLIALIELSLADASNYFLSAAGSWAVTFNKGGSAGGTDIFHP